MISRVPLYYYCLLLEFIFIYPTTFGYLLVHRYGIGSKEILTGLFLIYSLTVRSIQDTYLE